MDTNEVRQLLEEAFAPVLGTEEDFDVIADGDDISVVTPAWSVLLTDWSGEPIARVKLREQVDSLDASAEREDVMGYEIDEAFAYADLRVDGRITAALNAAGDPLSMSLANTMTEIAARLPT